MQLTSLSHAHTHTHVSVLCPLPSPYLSALVVLLVQTIFLIRNVLSSKDEGLKQSLRVSVHCSTSHPICQWQWGSCQGSHSDLGWGDYRY